MTDTRKDGRLMRIMRRLQGQNVEQMDRVEDDADYAYHQWAPTNEYRAAEKKVGKIGPASPTEDRHRAEMADYGQRVKMRKTLGEDSRRSRVHTAETDPETGEYSFAEIKRKRKK